MTRVARPAVKKPRKQRVVRRVLVWQGADAWGASLNRVVLTFWSGSDLPAVEYEENVTDAMGAPTWVPVSPIEARYRIERLTAHAFAALAKKAGL